MKDLKQKKLPKTRKSATHEFVIDGIKVFLTVGMYADGSPGEIFITVAKEGSTLGGLFNTISIVVSMALQYGVSIDKLCAKLSYMAFPPQGFVAEFGYANSIVDYIFRYLAKEYGTKEVKEEKRMEVFEDVKKEPAIEKGEDVIQTDAPACKNCGGLTKRSGSCYCCTQCGDTSGCS